MIKSMRETVEVLYAEVAEKKAQGGVDLVGITTGYKDIDYATGGYRRGGLYIVAAQSGSGKSSFATSGAIQQLSKGHSVLYVTLEMSGELMATRILSGQTGLNAMRIERGALNDEEFERLGEHAELLKSDKFYIIDTAISSEGLIQMTTDFIQEGNELDVIYVDYASLLSDRSENAFEKESRIALRMKELALITDRPVVCLAQLNRNALNRSNSRPLISDIKQTGGYGEHASAVLMPYRPYIEKMLSEGLPPIDKEDDAVIIISKNRHGPNNIEVGVNFFPKQMRWADKYTEPRKAGRI